ncbi:MAG TPA: hypothetical protein VML55_27035 [Planctomycetaceae bacterium]|nr:hypothetical protein [Planctomycetaceae bacterium]
MNYNRISVASVVALLSASLHAGVPSPRVVSEHTADAWSMRTFADFPRWRALTGDAKAWAMFEYLTDPHTGLYPMGLGSREGNDSVYELGVVRDPVKLINVHSLGYCDVLGPVMAGIWEDAGCGPARTLDLPGWGHVTSEVFYDGGWHYLDLDVRAAFRRDDGRLASMAEAQRDDSLWPREPGPRFFPLDDLPKVRNAYANTHVRHRYGVHQSGHTMSYALRRGETFTRWWKPQGGRWLHHESFHKDDFFRQLIEREPRGPKGKHAGFSVHTYGNGRFVYRPNLKAGSADFADGVYDSDNVRPGKDGLTLERSGEGFAVFEVRSPYVIVPVVGKLESKDDDQEASVVEIDAAGAEVQLSIDNGATFKPLEVKQFPATLDLTKDVAGTYSYLLRITLKGEPDQAVVRSLGLTTWVQLAPASLPPLRQGTNRMELRTGDHYGLPTRVVEIRPDTSNETEFFKQVVLPPREYDPKHGTQRIRGEFTVRVSAPPRAKIAWLSAGGSFYTHQGEAASGTRNRMAYAVDRPESFQEFYRTEIPADVEHWHYNAQREIRLDEPARHVYVRYTGDPAVNAVRIYAHCIDDEPRPVPPVRVTHAWRENGEPKSYSTDLTGPGAYEITVEGDPENESIELAVASDAGV